jgi:hypothetical protein
MVMSFAAQAGHEQFDIIERKLVCNPYL